MFNVSLGKYGPHKHSLERLSRDQKLWLLLFWFLNGEILISSLDHSCMRILWYAAQIPPLRKDYPSCWVYCLQQFSVVSSIRYYLSCRGWPHSRSCPFRGWPTSSDWRMQAHKGMSLSNSGQLWRSVIALEFPVWSTEVSVGLHSCLTSSFSHYFLPLPSSFVNSIVPPQYILCTRNSVSEPASQGFHPAAASELDNRLQVSSLHSFWSKQGTCPHTGP